MKNEYIMIYAIMPSYLYTTKELTGEEKLIAERITALCRQKGYSWISNKSLADMYGIREDTVSKHIKKLKDIGFIKCLYGKDTNNKSTRIIYLTNNIWDKYPNNDKYTITQDQLTALVEATTFKYRTATDYYDLYESDTSIYRTYIEPVVKGALNASFTQRVIITKGNDNITKVEDGKYYQTAKITVSGDPASELVSFDVEFKGVEGAFAVDAATGTKIESLSNIPKGTDFYVRVPVDKVTQTLQELQIEVSGHFNTFFTNDYGEGNNQKVISVDDATRIFVKGTDYDLVGAPDTGMSAAQTIYFIGLIVLLCGVGIVYANAKPIENN